MAEIRFGWNRGEWERAPVARSVWRYAESPLDAAAVVAGLEGAEVVAELVDELPPVLDSDALEDSVFAPAPESVR